MKIKITSIVVTALILVGGCAAYPKTNSAGTPLNMKNVKHERLSTEMLPLK